MTPDNEQLILINAFQQIAQCLSLLGWICSSHRWGNFTNAAAFQPPISHNVCWAPPRPCKMAQKCSCTSFYSPCILMTNFQTPWFPSQVLACTSSALKSTCWVSCWCLSYWETFARVAVKWSQLKPGLSLVSISLQAVPKTSKKLQKPEVKLVQATEMKKQREPHMPQDTARI